LTYTSTFDVEAHLDVGPSGPPGNVPGSQTAQSNPYSEPFIYLLIRSWNRARCAL